MKNINDKPPYVYFHETRKEQQLRRGKRKFAIQID